MRMITGLNWGFAALALAAGAAQAETSTTTSETVVPSLKDKFNISYYSETWLPSINELGSGHLNASPGFADPGVAGAAAKVDDTGVASIENYLGAYYRLSPEMKIGPVVHAFLNADSKNPISVKELYLRLGHAKLVSVGNFSLAGDVRAYSPGLKNDLIVGMRSTQISNFDVPNTRLSLGAATIQRVNANATSSPDYILGLAGIGNFQLTPKMSISLWTDIFSMTANSKGFNFDPSDIQPGLSFDITPNLNLNPKISFVPGAADFWGATNFVLDITATLL